MSTGDGKPRVLDEKQTSVYKRALGQEYHLRMKASRAVYTEISRKFPTMPFTIRALEDSKAKLGIIECVNHDLLHPYSVLHEVRLDLALFLFSLSFSLKKKKKTESVSPALTTNRCGEICVIYRKRENS